MASKSYKMFFSSKVRSVLAEEKDSYLALASLDALKPYLPSNINAETNVDLLPIAFSACNVNRFNLNDDGINTETALSIADTFINKPIDLDHDRTKIVGVILSVGFCEYGSEKPLTREQVKDYTKPFNICLGGVIWKVVNDDLVEAIENASDPESDTYRSICASWEIALDDYDIVAIEGKSKNLEDGKIIVNKADADPLLRANEGKGVYEGKRIYRLANKGVLAVGIGLTEEPAAAVKGILTASNEEEANMETNETLTGTLTADKIILAGKDLAETIKEQILAQFVSDESILKLVEACKQKENKDQLIIAANETLTKTNETEKLSVTTHNNIIMDKISNIKDITDENLKVIKACAITDFVLSEITKSSEAWTTEKGLKDAEIKAEKDKQTALANDLAQTKEEAKKLKDEFDKLSNTVAAQQKQELFNQRMASFDSTYNLTDEDRSALALQVKDLDETAFASLEKTLAPLMKEKRKDYKKIESTASQTEKDGVIDDAVAKAEKEKQALAHSNPPSKSFKEKFAGAFSMDNVTVDSGKKR